jgi:hypothetical protein
MNTSEEKSQLSVPRELAITFWFPLLLPVPALTPEKRRKRIKANYICFQFLFSFISISGMIRNLG